MGGPITLSNDNLSNMPDGVLVPAYDRNALSPGIVHIGLGNFHRAHQAWYLHRLMQAGLAHDWAIIGAGVRAPDAMMREKLLDQDCLTTLITLDADRSLAEVTGPMIDFLPIDETNAPLIKAMCDPAIRIVSLTVTEGGYYRDASGKLDVNHPDIQHDAAHPEKPRTAFGAIVAAYKFRRETGHLPFTGQCCDNLQNNGDVLRETVVGLARLSDPDLADWIDTSATFPNAMVDCIVPATGDAERALVRDLGIADAAPVTHEDFRQWVIEDDFCAGRPPWQEVGVTLTANVHAFEAMKIRMLNAGHQVLANVGELLGMPTIAACMADPTIAAFFRKVEEVGIAPYVDPVPNMAPLDYLDLISRRFANPKIHDTTRRVAFDGSSRHTGFVLPILRDALEQGGEIDGLALTEALWARMCAGTREDGSDIQPNDPHWADLNAAALAARDNPQIWLDQQSIYGELGQDSRFSPAFCDWLARIWENGSRQTLESFNGG